MTTSPRMDDLRASMSEINDTLLVALNEFFAVAQQIGAEKTRLGLELFDPEREAAMLQALMLENQRRGGALPADVLQRVFKELFRQSIELMGRARTRSLRVHREPGETGLVVTIPLPDGDAVAVGGPWPVFFGGPCAVESREQMMATAARLRELGVRVLRGGAFKPRTSPYSFQGLEEAGLKIMREAADAHGMAIVTEALSVREVDVVAAYADVLQVGARNMSNFSLLKEVGRAGKPVFLKRGMAATVDELLLAAEYVHLGGESRIILCERGVRTFETRTRNTLDIAAVPLLKDLSVLPVVVDVSHALGRKDIALPVARAALAAGADGVMFEAHANPAQALSDCDQQLDPDETGAFMAAMEAFMPAILELRNAHA